MPARPPARRAATCAPAPPSTTATGNERRQSSSRSSSRSATTSCGWAIEFGGARATCKGGTGGRRQAAAAAVWRSHHQGVGRHWVACRPIAVRGLERPAAGVEERSSSSSSSEVMVGPWRAACALAGHPRSRLHAPTAPRTHQTGRRQLQRPRRPMRTLRHAPGAALRPPGPWPAPWLRVQMQSASSGSSPGIKSSQAGSSSQQGGWSAPCAAPAVLLLSSSP